MKIAITRADGGVSIMTVVPASLLTNIIVRGAKDDFLDGFSDDEMQEIIKKQTEIFLEDSLDKWKEENPGQYVSHREILDEAIPTDREFRDAWMATGDPVIAIDMGKARTIHLNRIRTKRNAELANLDIEATKAQDQGDDKALQQIRARKQQLRDLPQTIQAALDAANTIDTLKAIQPL